MKGRTTEDNEFDAEQEEREADNLYLIFHLDREDYGISIRHVTEIVGKQNITHVPNLPNYVQGVINLRGKVIPVIDVRTRFGLPFREYNDRTCAIVITVTEQQFGLIVDMVDEVISIDEEKISPPLALAPNGASEFIQGMGRTLDQDKVKLLLNVESLFRNETNETPVRLEEA